jgi:hypothetical protein
MPRKKGSPRPKALTPGERELTMLIAMERTMIAFVDKFSRAKQRHEPIRRALEHVIEERSLLKMALAGDPDAIIARRMQDDITNSLGE